MSDTVFANTKAGNAAVLSDSTALHCVTNRAETRVHTRTHTNAHRWQCCKCLPSELILSLPLCLCLLVSSSLSLTPFHSTHSFTSEASPASFSSQTRARRHMPHDRIIITHSIPRSSPYRLGLPRTPRPTTIPR